LPLSPARRKLFGAAVKWLNQLGGCHNVSPGDLFGIFLGNSCLNRSACCCNINKNKKPKATRYKKKNKKKRTHCVPLSTATRILCDEIYA